MVYHNFKKHDIAAAKFLSTERLVICEQAFGTSDSRIVRAVYRLADCLEEQEKWKELEVHWKIWGDVVKAPESFDVSHMRDLRTTEAQSGDDQVDNLDDVAMREDYEGDHEVRDDIESRGHAEKDRRMHWQ